MPLEAGSGSGDGAGYDVDAELDEDDYDDLEGSGGRDDVYRDDDYRDDYRDEYDEQPTGHDDFGRSGDAERDPDNTFSNTVDAQTPEDTNRVPGSSLPSGAHKPRMSLARAVTVLVCPTLVAWIGTFI